MRKDENDLEFIDDENTETKKQKKLDFIIEIEKKDRIGTIEKNTKEIENDVSKESDVSKVSILSKVTNSFFYHLLFVITIITFILVGVATFISASFSYSDISKLSSNIIRNKSLDINYRLNAYFDTIGRFTATIVANPEYTELIRNYKLRNVLTDDDLRKYKINSVNKNILMNNIKNYMREIDAIFIIDLKGNVVGTTNAVYKDKSFFQKESSLGGTLEDYQNSEKLSFFENVFERMEKDSLYRFISDRVLIHNKWYFYFVISIKNESDSIKGYFIMQVSVDKFIDKFLNNNKILEHGYSFIVENQSKRGILYHKKIEHYSDLDVNLNHFFIENYKEIEEVANVSKFSITDQSLLSKIEQYQGSFYQTKSKTMGEAIMYGVSNPYTNWVIFSQISKNELLMPIYRMMGIVILSSIAIFIVYFIISYRLIKKGIVNIKNLINFSNGIGNGDFGSNASKFVFEKEFDSIYRNLEKVRLDLKKSILEVKEKSKEIEDIAYEIKEIDTVVLEISDKEVNEMDFIYKFMSEIRGKIYKSSRSSNALTKSFSNTKDSILEKKENMKNLLSFSDKISNEIVHITNISHTMNMVSLNATIQANNISTKNKNTFTTVANEMRDLSKKTREITKEIAGISMDAKTITVDISSFLKDIIPTIENDYKNLEEMDSFLNQEQNEVEKMSVRINNINTSIRQNFYNLKNIALKSDEIFNRVVNINKSLNLFRTQDIDIELVEFEGYFDKKLKDIKRIFASLKIIKKISDGIKKSKPKTNTKKSEKLKDKKDKPLKEKEQQKDTVGNKNIVDNKNINDNDILILKTIENIRIDTLNLEYKQDKKEDILKNLDGLEDMDLL